jgi:hypothetical protein
VRHIHVDILLSIVSPRTVVRHFFRHFFYQESSSSFYPEKVDHGMLHKNPTLWSLRMCWVRGPRNPRCTYQHPIPASLASYQQMTRCGWSRRYRAPEHAGARAFLSLVRFPQDPTKSLSSQVETLVSLSLSWFKKISQYNDQSTPDKWD